MTSQGRTVVAVVALLVALALVVLGVIEDAEGATTAGASLATLIVGYAFGDRNGEKRLADALTILEAERTRRGP